MEDALFYNHPRMVRHLDKTALATLERVIGGLLMDRGLVILDLMASWDSHIPGHLTPAQVVGLGLNHEELEANPLLTSRVIHDLNQDPRLPFPDRSFDAVINALSVDYLTDPTAVFNEAGRVLRPGGLLIVAFSNRWFEPKVTKVWRLAGEAERAILVEQWLRQAGGFTEARAF